MNPLCLDFLSAGEASPQELVMLASVHQLPFVTLPTRPLNGLRDWGLVGDTATRRETIALCRSLGVTVDVIESYFVRPDFEVESLRADFETGAALSARRVVMVTQDPNSSRLLENARALCDLAAEHGLGVVVEYTPRCSQRTVSEAVDFVAEIGRTDVMVEADALHTFRGGSALEEIAAAAASLGRAQLCDGPWESPDDGLHEALWERGTPGEGDLPLVDFIRALPPDIVIGIEAPQTWASDGGETADRRVARLVAATRSLLHAAERD